MSAGFFGCCGMQWPYMTVTRHLVDELMTELLAFMCRKLANDNTQLRKLARSLMEATRLFVQAFISY